MQSVSGPVYGTCGPVVINLEYRTDRWNNVDARLRAMGYTSLRIDAIRREDGALGCLESHCKALEEAIPKNQPVWICEDDMKPTVGREQFDLHIKEFLESSAQVLCLGFNDRQSVPYAPFFRRSFDVQTTSSYLVKPAFQPVLLDLWKSVAECRRSGTKHPLEPIYKELRKKNVFVPNFYFADQCWKVLQQNHIFLIPKIHLSIQDASYSDIERKMTNYGC